MDFYLKMGWSQPLNSHLPWRMNRRPSLKKQRTQSLRIMGNQSFPTDSKCSSAHFSISSCYNICSIILSLNLTRRLYSFWRTVASREVLGLYRGWVGKQAERKERLKVASRPLPLTCSLPPRLCAHKVSSLLQMRRAKSWRSFPSLLPTSYEAHVSLQPAHSFDWVSPGQQFVVSWRKGACSRTRQTCWDLGSRSLKAAEAKQSGPEQKWSQWKHKDIGILLYLNSTYLLKAEKGQVSPKIPCLLSCIQREETPPGNNCISVCHLP